MGRFKVKSLEIRKWRVPAESPIAIIIEKTVFIFTADDGKRYKTTDWTVRLTAFKTAFNFDIHVSASLTRKCEEEAEAEEK